jgi:hypothetical protein
VLTDEMDSVVPLPFVKRTIGHFQQQYIISSAKLYFLLATKPVQINESDFNTQSNLEGVVKNEAIAEPPGAVSLRRDYSLCSLLNIFFAIRKTGW